MAENNVNLEPIDESIESTIENNLVIIIAHMAKFVYMPDKATNSWVGSIFNNYGRISHINNKTTWDSLSTNEFIMNRIMAKAIKDIDDDIHNKFRAEQAFDLWYDNIRRLLKLSIDMYDTSFKFDLYLLHDWHNIYDFLQQDMIWNNISDIVKNKIYEKVRNLR